MILLLASALAEDESIRYGRATLSDGLDVTVVEQPDSARVTLAWVVDGGRATEEAPGLARAAAQSWFLGKSGPVSTVAEAYERLGALVEADVDVDHTIFVTVVPPEQLAGALTLEWLRLSDPLADVVDVAPITHEASIEAFNGRTLAPVFNAVLPEGNPYRNIWTIPTVDTHPTYLVSHWVQGWRPDKATLVIAGPVKAGETLCTIEAKLCSEDALPVASQRLRLPDDRTELPPASGRGARVGPMSAGIPETLLMSWTVGREAPVGLVAFMREHIQEQLGAAKCHRFSARDGHVLTCQLPAVQTPDDVLKGLKKGWDVKRWRKQVDDERRRAVNGLLGSSAEPDFARRLAIHLRDGGKPGPYAGAWEAQAYGVDDVIDLAEGAFSPDRAVFVRLGP